MTEQSIKDWERWQHLFLINQWKADGNPEANLSYVEWGLDFRPNGNGLVGHHLSKGVAYIQGYRIFWDMGATFTLTANKINLIYLKLVKTVDPTAGFYPVEPAISVVVGTDTDRPAEPSILLGWIETAAGSPYVTSDNIHWFDNLLHIPSKYDRDKALTFKTNELDVRFTDILKLEDAEFYYRLDEESGSCLSDAPGTQDVLVRQNETADEKIRAVRGIRRKAQYLDNYLGGTNLHYKATAAAKIKGEVETEKYFMSVLIYPMRQDVDMEILYKDNDFHLYWDSVATQIVFEVDNGAGAFTRFVKSPAMTDFAFNWHHIYFGHHDDGAGKGLFIVIDNGIQNLEAAPAGAIGTSVLDFYLGSSTAINGIKPFYGIVDEFCKWKDIGLNRFAIIELNNRGGGNTVKPPQPFCIVETEEEFIAACENPNVHLIYVLQRPAGKYIFTAAIAITSDTKVRGIGKVEFDWNAAPAILFDNSSGDNIVFENLWFIRTGNAYGPFKLGDDCQLHEVHSDSDLTDSNFDGSKFRASDCKMESGLVFGLYSTITDVKLTNSKFGKITLYDVSQVHASNCSLAGLTIFVESGYETNRDIHFVNCDLIARATENIPIIFSSLSGGSFISRNYKFNNLTLAAFNDTFPAVKVSVIDNTVVLEDVLWSSCTMRCKYGYEFINGKQKRWRFDNNQYTVTDAIEERTGGIQEHFIYTMDGYNEFVAPA